MRNLLRSFVVGLMVLALSINPANACHFCGGYYSSPVYYGCGGCGVVVYDDCGCDSCDGAVVEEHDAKAPAPDVAPQGPVEAAPQPQQPATVDRPIEEAPAPSLPAQPETEAQPVPPADDLFNGTEETTPPAAVEEPATEKADDDLFGGAAEETPEATTPAETLPPAEAPAETPDTDESDDLFGGTEETESTPTETEEMPVEETTPVEEAPADGETPKAEETDDIFGASQRVLREKGGLASAEMRLWVDNTGTYSCHGRLVRFMDGHVRILKDNGRTTTVPLYRLSAGDLGFVNRQANAQKAERFQTAQTSITLLRLTN